MADSELKRFIPAYGDRMAVRIWSEQLSNTHGPSHLQLGADWQVPKVVTCSRQRAISQPASPVTAQ